MCEDREELHQCEKCDINVRKMKVMRKKWQQHENSLQKRERNIIAL